MITLQSFSMPILLRKIQAIFRRIVDDTNLEKKSICYKNIILNLNEYTVSVNNTFIELHVKSLKS